MVNRISGNFVGPLEGNADNLVGTVVGISAGVVLALTLALTAILVRKGDAVKKKMGKVLHLQEGLTFLKSWTFDSIKPNFKR